MQVKSLLVGLCLGVVACALGGLLVLSLGGAAETEAVAPKWEYKVVRPSEFLAALPELLEEFADVPEKDEAAEEGLFDALAAIGDPIAAAVEKYINSLGNEGWELVSIGNDGLMVFRRRVEQ